LKSKLDLGKMRIRLENISKKATSFVSFYPTDISFQPQDFYSNAKLVALEEINNAYRLNPNSRSILSEWNIYAYDESTQKYSALEGEIFFCSSAIVKLEDRYSFNLSVLPYFLTSMTKFKDQTNEDIRFTENIAEAENLIMINSKIDSILGSVEPHSIVLIDGPLIGGNASSHYEKMDEELRKRDCIPLYFVKNSDSRLVLDSSKELCKEFNSDFHWSACTLQTGSRSAFFQYTDQHVKNHTKVFTYVKALYGFPERVEMHTQTYYKYREKIDEVMNLLAYFYIVQGDRSNPQVRPIAIAEKYAREGIRVLNIPALLSRLGFKPTINQVRFG
jgi:hypothetical protein